MKKQIYLIVGIILLGIISINASEQAQITCGGDAQVQINCLNAQDLSFWGNLPSQVNQNTLYGSGGSLPSYYTYSGIISIVKNNILITCLLFFIFIINFY